MPATYTKLKSGDWGIRVTGRTVKAGDAVTVERKDGSAKEERIAHVLFAKDGMSICAIEQRPRRAGGGPAETKTCWECGMQFTFADCKRNGGDWGDGYCGC